MTEKRGNGAWNMKFLAGKLLWLWKFEETYGTGLRIYRHRGEQGLLDLFRLMDAAWHGRGEPGIQTEAVQKQV